MRIGMEDAINHVIEANGSSTNLKFKTAGTDRVVIGSTGNMSVTGTITAAAINSTGNVGIGTNNPDKLLHLKSSGATGIAIESTTNAQNLDIDFYNNGGSAAGRIRYSEGPGAFSFAPNASSTDALTIANGGDVSVEKGNLLLSGASSSIDPTLSMSDDAGYGVAGTKIWYSNSNGFTNYDSYWTGGGGHKFRSQLAGTTVNNMILHRDGDLGFGTLNPASFGDGNIEFKDTRGAQLGMRISSSATSSELGVDTYGTYIQSVTANRGLRLYTSDTSAADTMALQITPQGLVTKPKMTATNSAFYAAGTSNPSSTAGTHSVVFTTLKQGGGYSTTTGRYTCPVAGWYSFTTNVRIDAYNSTTGYLRIAFYTGTSPNVLQNGITQGHAIYGPGTYSSNYFSMSTAWQTYLAAGTQVGVAVLSNTGTFTRHTESNFTGVLIG